jgi:hypothetical protein
MENKDLLMCSKEPDTMIDSEPTKFILFSTRVSVRLILILFLHSRIGFPNELFQIFRLKFCNTFLSFP